MKALYIRVSTLEQNTDRQTEKGINTYIDKVSGSMAFKTRPQAKKLLAEVEKGIVTEIQVHSIDRLGRNTLDIMQTIESLTEKGVNVISKKEGLQTIVEGKENPVAKMMIGILGTLSEFELTRIKERQAEGIAEAKKRGVYKTNGGNKPKESVEQFLSKTNNAKCYKLIKTGTSLRNSAKLAGVSLGTAQKISKLIKDDLI